MTSILKADNIQDADGNNIINESSNTITIGASGDTTNIIGTLQNNGAAVGGTNTPNFEVTLSGGVSIANSTTTKITFDTETFDSDNAFASNKFTVPSGKAGKYFFYAQYAMPDLAGDNKQMQIHLKKNDSTIKKGFERTYYDQTVEVSCVLDLSEGDYIDVYARQNSGSSITISSGATGTFFTGFKLVE